MLGDAVRVTQRASVLIKPTAGKEVTWRNEKRHTHAARVSFKFFSMGNLHFLILLLKPTAGWEVGESGTWRNETRRAVKLYEPC